MLTVTQNRLPIKMVVFNNSSLNFVELEMKAAGSSRTAQTSSTLTSLQ